MTTYTYVLFAEVEFVEPDELEVVEDMALFGDEVSAVFRTDWVLATDTVEDPPHQKLRSLARQGRFHQFSYIMWRTDGQAS